MRVCFDEDPSLLPPHSGSFPLSFPLVTSLRRLEDILRRRLPHFVGRIVQRRHLPLSQSPPHRAQVILAVLSRDAFRKAKP